MRPTPERKKASSTESNTDGSRIAEGYDAAVRGEVPREDDTGRGSATAAAARTADAERPLEAEPGPTEDLPDRDQMFDFGTGRVTEPLLDRREDAWSGDLEERVKGRRNLAHDAVDELGRHTDGVEHVPDGDDATAERGFEDADEDDEGEHAAMSPGQTRSRAEALDRAVGPSDFDTLRLLLERRKSELITVIVASQHTIQELLAPTDDDHQVDFNHPSDMIAGDDYEKHLKLAEQQKAELTLVNQALHRLDQDEFGVCDTCGDGIGLARLTAVPYTKHCVTCQERYEQVDRHPRIRREAKVPGAAAHDAKVAGAADRI